MRVAVYAWVSIAAVLAAAVGPGLAPDVARADPPGAHTITYIAKVDAPISSGRAIYMVNDTYTATAPLSATGREFTTTTMLADPAKAGMQVSIPWPYSGNVHCEIDVDNHIVAQVDQFVVHARQRRPQLLRSGVVRRRVVARAAVVGENLRRMVVYGYVVAV
ncbi:hypothetical protein OSH39_21115 [Mycobacterium ulcerans]|nr:hypothetical protein [Mycobacterium ulcerans]MEB3910895.1 hypothetical protein [Mycobacterium ulcerans]MEB3947937.1 hypothetical protein [Mycobacterium ulcerans]MEB3970931.1 hypothetical protein [Mycobacterium ulcerans]MEB3979193.1 hypothetical protein [Mycobacterium ulcerans]